MSVSGGESGAATSGSQYEVSQGSKLWQKTKDAPYVPLGIAGMVGMVAYGAYAYRFKGSMSTSVYLMHLRVRAQSMVVGAMTLGVGYTLLRDYYFKKDEKK